MIDFIIGIGFLRVEDINWRCVVAVVSADVFSAESPVQWEVESITLHHKIHCSRVLRTHVEMC